MSKQSKKSTKKAVQRESAEEIYERWRNSPATPIGGPAWEDLPVDDPIRKIMLEEAANPGTMAERRAAVKAKQIEE